MTEKEAQELLTQLSMHYQCPVMPVSKYCDALHEWARLTVERDPDLKGTWNKFNEIELAISKSCLLSRTIYGGEKPSQTPCPVHEGKWSGIHCGWPETFWHGVDPVTKERTVSPIEESEQLREWYDAGCRCYQHNSCGCTTGWQPDSACGCKPA